MKKQNYDKNEWKISIPLAIDCESHDNAYWQKKITQLKRQGARRVFMTLICQSSADPISYFENQAERILEIGAQIRAAGMSPCIWLGHTIGHGGGTTLDGAAQNGETFTQIVGAHSDGRIVEKTGSFCPMDPHFQTYICNVLAVLAGTHPDILMIDDDFRLAFHDSLFGCFCKYHMAKLAQKIGKKISVEDLLKKIKTDFALRKAWREVNGKSLEDMAKLMEKTVHGIAPETRFGACTGTFGFGSDGISQARLTAAMNGNGATRPFIRSCFAPYWSRVPNDIGWQIEAERYQAAMIHAKLPEAEIMAEGDTYPHTTFSASAASLEAFHEGLETSGFETVLSYQFNYGDDRATDMSFPNIITKNKKRHQILRQVSPPEWTEFGFEPVHSYDGFFYLDSELSDWEGCWNLQIPALKLFPRLGLPIAFGNSSMPVVLFSEECAAYSDGELNAFLKRGAVIDAPAAEILLKRGFDLGISNLKRCNAVPQAEYCDGTEILLRTGGSNVYWTYTPCKTATLRTTFSDNQPGVAFIPLKNGQKIVFLPWNTRRGDFWFNLQFCTQTALQDAFAFLYGAQLPAMLVRQGDVRLHCRISPDGKTLAISVQNISLDEFQLGNLKIAPGLKVIGCLPPGRTTVRAVTKLPHLIIPPAQMAVLLLARA